MRQNNALRIMGAAFVLGCVCTFASASPILIDDFSSGGISFLVNTSTTTASSTTAATVLGGQRYAQLDWSPVSTVRDRLRINYNGIARLIFNEDAQSAATFTIRYGSSSSELNADLANGANAFRFVFSSVEYATNLIVKVTTGSTNTQTVIVPLAAASVATDVDIAFSLFAGLDFSDVDQIEFSITGVNGGDYILQKVETIEVPEPAAVVLLASGGVLALIRRRRTA